MSDSRRAKSWSADVVPALDEPPKSGQDAAATVQPLGSSTWAGTVPLQEPRSRLLSGESGERTTLSRSLHDFLIESVVLLSRTVAFPIGPVANAHDVGRFSHQPLPFPSAEA